MLRQNCHPMFFELFFHENFFSAVVSVRYHLSYIPNLGCDARPTFDENPTVRISFNAIMSLLT